MSHCSIRSPSVSDPLNHTSSLGYDAQGRLTSVTNALNQTWRLTPDSRGRPLSLTSPVPISATTTFGYTGADLTTITDPLNRVTTRVPDAVGRLLRLINARGDATSYQYDRLNRLLQITDAENGLTRLAYDPNGNLTGVTDANNRTTSYQYDSMDRLQRRTDPLGRARPMTTIMAGISRASRIARIRRRALTMTALNRRTIVQYPDTGPTSYLWDSGNRLQQVGEAAGACCCVPTMGWIG